jgi:nicotinate-nucleotide pyrophosphorylase (carboxylating)
MLSSEEIRRAVQTALAEDIGSGDVTTLATVPETTRVNASLVAREPMVVAGLPLAEAAFLELCSQAKIERLAADGSRAAAGQVLLKIIDAPARPILAAERVALNFVEAIAGTAARVLDTRKTTPGWRSLEKYAVRCGGGKNHRFGLFDQILIKDNHLAALRHEPPNAIEAAVRRARARFPGLTVEVEADTPEQVDQALLAGAEIILLDNMPLEQMRTAVKRVNHRARTEASGGVTLDTVRAIAETGVDFISVGALTHSARAMDLALDFDAQC